MVDDLKLYGGLLSPFVMRPVLAARAKGHDIAVDQFPGGIKCEEYLALTPTGKMPLLVHGHFALPESQPITDYLDAVLPGPALLPADPQAQARTRLLVRLADVYMVPHLGGLFTARDKPEGVPAAMAGVAGALGYIEHFRGNDDEFAIGDSFSQADAALIPLFYFLDALDAGLGTAKLLDATPGLAAWWTRAKASDIGARAVAEQTAGMKAMFAARG
ncbi:glutathione S-transferase [Polymorphobacter multimanifer]|uniref:Glutathione S-transferase n=2 Tax=Polymorphobacter multimanifer TaxID=1070431 RepID=A0A841L929_9SPHN|nr:glutathione S-transferase family protein [Polymorphobacter multimanifer]MBB6228676.1 glutathione S-transferase [Polymorphobacter multimanifer]